MSTDVKDKLPELSAATLELSKQLQSKIEIDTKTGIATIGQDAYEQLLPADIPLETVKKLQAHHTHLFAAAFDAVGTKALAVANTAKKLTEVTASFPLAGKDRLDVTWTKEVERNAGLPTGDGKPVPKKTVYGVMTGKLITTGTDTGAGELGKVAKRQKAAALEMFGSSK
jgi:hypothetical protein